MTTKRIQPTSLWRITLLQLVVFGVFVTFSLRLWHLQVVVGSHYSELAGRNHTRLIASETPRGVIYSRPEDSAAQEVILQRLHELLDVPLVSDLAPPPFPPFRGSAKLGLRDLVTQGSLYAPYKPIVLKKHVSPETAFIVEEEHLDLPGVLVEVYSHREYLTGSLTAHLIGYVGPIPSGAGDRYRKEQGYEANDKVGLTGLEHAYEDVLRGQKGTRTIELDVAGREVRTIQATPSRAGHNLILTLDLDLQRYVEQVLRDGMQQAGSRSAVAIITKVNTGEVLAMVSLPTYDNNLFAQGISNRDLTRLNTDPAHPMLNHAITGQYPPGSTFKLVPAAAALEEEVVERWTLLTCPADSGILYLPNRYDPDSPELAQPFYCWTARWGYGHGRVDFISAIAVSCDIYFYTIGGGLLDRFEGLGLERLRTYAEAFGYGSATGIDLSAEAPGRVPDEQWQRVTRGERWTTGDTYNMTIGQGDVLATPLQVVNATAAIANGGALYRPQLVYQVLDANGDTVQDFQPQVIRRLPISEDNLELVRKGMRAAVERGTAQDLQVGGGLEVAAKTGTSEFYAPGLPVLRPMRIPRSLSWSLSTTAAGARPRRCQLRQRSSTITFSSTDFG
jgi:penicillin-binding protein 2